MSSDSVVVRLHWEAHSWGSVLSCLELPQPQHVPAEELRAAEVDVP
jgi:hypothetical protein